ncbi:MAG: DUF3090 domain-containing protein [Anaerolinea sp.]|nr:DUF3090 domain-containing protein [Anaerolinea sp.]
MPKYNLELDPVSHISVEAIGQPGERVFYLQGRQGEQIITLLVEKIQIQTLAIGIEQFLFEIAEQIPTLEPPSAEYDEMDMHLMPPFDPLFRVGELGLAYDETRDRMCLVAREALIGQEDPEDLSVVRFWASRTQMLILARWCVELASRGRAICPQCGEPIDPAGHFCPKKNGHKH